MKNQLIVDVLPSIHTSDCRILVMKLLLFKHFSIGYVFNHSKVAHEISQWKEPFKQKETGSKTLTSKLSVKIYI